MSAAMRTDRSSISRNFFYLIVVLALAAAAGAEEYKIGVVDAMEVLEQSPQAERMASELRVEFEERNREIIEMQKQVTELNEKLTNNVGAMSGDDVARLERELFVMNRELQRLEDQYKEDFSFRRNEILTALQDEIIEAIITVSEQHNYDIVLTGGVNWTSPKTDMTPLVIEYLKNKK
jgi:outer membrane protein